jgi:hypothetical protein
MYTNIIHQVHTLLILKSLFVVCFYSNEYLKLPFALLPLPLATG